MQPVKTWVKFILVLFGIPAIGWVSGIGLSAKIENEFIEAVTATQRLARADVIQFSEACQRPGLRASLASLCGTYDDLHLLEVASLGSAAGALCVIALVWLTARLCRGNRSLLARMFGVEMRLILAAICVLILVQGAILTYAAYMVEATLVHRVHVVLIAGIGLGALVGGFAMIRTAVTFAPHLRTFVIGVEVSRATQPKLWSFVDDVAKKVGGRPPTNIVVGVEPTFYATAADVQLTGTSNVLRGETMYLSTSLMRILSNLELSAVVGHELGHFKGSDTEYTLRFVPIYRGMEEAIGALGSTQGASALAMLPAIVTLRVCLNEFAKAERAIGRAREMEADKSGAAASAPSALVSALMKVAIFTPVWPQLSQAAVAMLNEGRMFTNMSTSFAEETQRIAGEVDSKLLIEGAASSRQQHPTDTHPTLEARAQALGVSIAETNCLPDAATELAIGLLQDVEEIEQAVTNHFAQVLLAVGAAQLPAQAPSPAVAEQAQA